MILKSTFLLLYHVRSFLWPIREITFEGFRLWIHIKLISSLNKSARFAWGQTKRKISVFSILRCSLLRFIYFNIVRKRVTEQRRRRTQSRIQPVEKQKLRWVIVDFGWYAQTFIRSAVRPEHLGKHRPSQRKMRMSFFFFNSKIFQLKTTISSNFVGSINNFQFFLLQNVVYRKAGAWCRLPSRESGRMKKKITFRKRWRKEYIQIVSVLKSIVTIRAIE